MAKVGRDILYNVSSFIGIDRFYRPKIRHWITSGL